MPGQQPCILLVDDEELNRHLARAILTRTADQTIKSATLLEAATLGEARTKLAEHAVDLVLLDVQLPDGSGLTLATEIGAAPPEQRPAIVVLTAGVLPEQRAAAHAAGCDTILAKPYTAADLIGAVSAVLSPGGVPS
jgi:two-component system, OmpR family, KDP operon response regulator KdpE